MMMMMMMMMIMVIYNRNLFVCVRRVCTYVCTHAHLHAFSSDGKISVLSNLIAQFFSHACINI